MFDRARNDLVDGARLGQYSVVLIWALGRLSRRGIEETLNVLRRLSGHVAHVWSHEGSWQRMIGAKDKRKRATEGYVAAWVRPASVLLPNRCSPSTSRLHQTARGGTPAPTSADPAGMKYAQRGLRV